MPGPVDWFPKEGLDAGSIRVVPQSVLGLSLLKRGYVATYSFGRAFLVRQANATQVMGKLRERFGETTPATVGDEAFSANDKYLGRLMVVRKGEWVAGFANLKEGADGVSCLKTLVARIP